MACMACGRDIEADSGWCRHCGASQRHRANRRLFRVPSRGRIAGVCAGIADYFDTDVTLVRLAWVVLSIVPGGIVGGVLAYAAAWMVMPESTATAAVTERTRLMRSPADRKIAGVCGGLAEFLGVDSTAVRVGWIVLTVVPGAIVCGAVAYLLAWFIMPERATAMMIPTPHAAERTFAHDRAQPAGPGRPPRRKRIGGQRVTSHTPRRAREAANNSAHAAHGKLAQRQTVEAAVQENRIIPAATYSPTPAAEPARRPNSSAHAAHRNWLGGQRWGAGVQRTSPRTKSSRACLE